MKILQICPGSYNKGLGGISEHIINISERLAKKHDVTVYATNKNNQYSSFEEINGVTVERFSRFPDNFYFFSLDMLKKLRRSDFNIVHGHAYSSFPVHFAMYSKYNRFIVTTHFHGYGHTFVSNLGLKVFDHYGSKTLKKADQIIAVSEYEKQMLLKYFKLSDEKITVIPNGVKKDEFSYRSRETELRQGENGDYKKLLYVGRLEAYKGILTLIEVMPSLKSDVILEIVGEGPIKEEIEKKIRDYNLVNRVVLSRRLSRSELLDRFFGADLFILLSRYEAYSLVVAEALSAGLDCILADTSALSEWIDGKRCYGLEYPIKSDDLIKLINQLLYNKKSAYEYSHKKILDWDEVVDQLNSLYVS